MARLTQRQDQLERQQMDSNRKVEALQRGVNRRLDSLRGETDRQIRDGERRVSSLERSRDTAQNLFWYSIPLVTAASMIIILVIAVVASREQRREAGEPEQRSPSSINAPVAGSGNPPPPGLADAGTPFRQPDRPTESAPTWQPWQPWPAVPGTKARRHSRSQAMTPSIRLKKAKSRPQGSCPAGRLAARVAAAGRPSSLPS